MFVNLGEPGELFGWYQKLIGYLPDWLWKPLGGCVKCFTGQVCFWFYLFKYYESYSLFDHAIFVSLGIFLAVIINKIYETANGSGNA